MNLLWEKRAYYQNFRMHNHFPHTNLFFLLKTNLFWKRIVVLHLKKSYDDRDMIENTIKFRPNVDYIYTKWWLLLTLISSYHSKDIHLYCNIACGYAKSSRRKKKIYILRNINLPFKWMYIPILVSWLNKLQKFIESS